LIVPNSAINLSNELVCGRFTTVFIYAPFVDFLFYTI